MAVKKIVFRENLVGSEVAVVKILVPNGPNMELLKQNFSFQSFRKTEAILLPIMWLIKIWYF